jgi:hypothetical protein
MGSGRTLTAAGGVAKNKPNVACSPLNPANSAACDKLGTVGNPDQGKHWFSDADTITVEAAGMGDVTCSSIFNHCTTCNADNTACMVR